MVTQRKRFNREIKQQPSLETIFIYCETYGCGHSVALDYAKTAAVLGWNFVIDPKTIVNHFFCTKCHDQGLPDKKLTMRSHPDHRPSEIRVGLPKLWLRHPQSELPPDGILPRLG